MTSTPTERQRPPITDEELARRLGTGDDASFDELYKRYAHSLTDFASRRLRDRAAGEDVAQTTLLSALTAIRRGAQPLHVRAWLYRIAENATFEAHRKRGDVAADGREEGRDDSQDAPFERAALLAGVKEMPPRQRDVYVLRELHGLPLEEVATRLELTSRQVEQALFMARNRLSEQLVFGGRLTCERVRTLDLGSLDQPQRRAVKSHLRGCPACRKAIGRWGLGLSTLGSLLRSLAELLPGGAAPVAAKVGAVAATAALAGGTPFAARTVLHALSHTPEARAAVAPIEPAAATAFATGAFARLVTPAFLRPAAPPTATAAPQTLFQQTSTGGPAPTAAGTTTQSTTTTTTADTTTADDQGDATDTSVDETDTVDTSGDQGDVSTDSVDDTTAVDTTDDSTATDSSATDATATDATDTTATDDSTATDPTATDPTSTTTP